jgi:hypothetical protein
MASLSGIRKVSENKIDLPLSARQPNPEHTSTHKLLSSSSNSIKPIQRGQIFRKQAKMMNNSGIMPLKVIYNKEKPQLLF